MVRCANRTTIAKPRSSRAGARARHRDVNTNGWVINYVISVRARSAYVCLKLTHTRRQYIIVVVVVVAVMGRRQRGTRAHKNASRAHSVLRSCEFRVRALAALFVYHVHSIDVKKLCKYVLARKTNGLFRRCVGPAACWRDRWASKFETTVHRCNLGLKPIIFSIHLRMDYGCAKTDETLLSRF